MIALIGNILNIAAFIGALFLSLPLLALLSGDKGLFAVSNGFASLFDKFILLVAHIAIWSGLAMIIIQVLSVLLRYMFGVNFIWMQESITYLFGIMFLLGSSFALLRDEHVRVDIFYSRFSAKRKALIDFLGTYLFLLPLCALILWAANGYVAASWRAMEGSPDASGIQAVYLLKSLIPAFATLLAMAGFVQANRAAAILRGLPVPNRAEGHADV